jgi:hypothetical protein
MGEALEPADIANKSVTKAVGLLRVMAAQPRTGATARKRRRGMTEERRSGMEML